MKKLLCIWLVLLAGCAGPDDPSIRALNKTTLGRGTVMGHLPDGREIRQYEIERGTHHNHFIYVVDGSVSVTTNKETGGKHSYNMAEGVIIDGVKFVPEKSE